MTWDALMEGKSISEHSRATLSFDESHSHRPSPDAPGGEEMRSRVSLLARQAAGEALSDAGWIRDVQKDASIAIIVGTSKGPVEKWIGPSESQIFSSNGYGLSDIAVELSNDFGIRGPRVTLSAACASGLHALIRAAMMIQSGEARRVLVVASEASLHPLFIGSFKRLGVLPPAGHGCRPLDETRTGFLMSEAAAAVCLEVQSDERRAISGGSDKGTKRRSDEGNCSPSVNSHRSALLLDSFAIGGDATHLTGGDPDGRTLRHLLNRVVGESDIDVVHAHATGTQLNDPIELAVIESVISSSPNLYSHKGALGHSLGAAGLVSIVLNCMIHHLEVIPPNVRTRNPIPSRMPIANQCVRRPIRRSIAIAAGFGGPTAAVMLRSISGS